MLYITLFFILLFIANLLIERRNLWIALTFGLATGFSLLYILVSLEANPIFKSLEWLRILVILVAATIAILILAGPLLLNLTFLYNGIKLLRREGFSFRNTLSLGIAVSLPVYIFIFPLLTNYINPQGIWAWIHLYLGLLIFYLISQASLYTVASVINMINLPKQDLDYIVVLGAGLMGTEVTPLLASRINKAISLYHKQTNAKLIMSGGQGLDEVISEAQAMTNYAIKQGVPPEDIILENQSTTTNENVRFSYALMAPNSIFAIVTNSYHIFRALLIAKKEGVKCIGYGAPSKFYFSLNAFIREFIAYLSLSRRKHLLILVALLILLTLIYLFSSVILPK